MKDQPFRCTTQMMWWQGDKRVEKYMPEVSKEIAKAGLFGDLRVQVYNKAYEAVYYAIKDMDLEVSNLKAENERLNTIVSTLKTSTDFYQSAIDRYEAMQKEVTK